MPKFSSMVLLTLSLDHNYQDIKLKKTSKNTHYVEDSSTANSQQNASQKQRSDSTKNKKNAFL